jgi:hypothetical protein
MLELHHNRTDILSGPTSVLNSRSFIRADSLTFVNQIPSEAPSSIVYRANRSVFSN